MPLEKPSLSAANVLFVRQLMLERMGENGVAQVKAGLPSDVCERYFGSSSLSWVPVDDVNLVAMRAAELLKIPVTEFATSMGRLSIERTLHTVWRVLLRFTSDEAIVVRTPVFYGRSYNVGKLATEVPKPGTARVALTQWPDVPQLTLLGLGAGIETVLRVTGRNDVRVNQHRTHHGAEFLATWRAA